MPNLTFGPGKRVERWKRPALVFTFEGLHSAEKVRGRLWATRHRSDQALLVMLFRPADLLDKTTSHAEAALGALSLAPIASPKLRRVELSGGLSLQVPEDWTRSAPQGGQRWASLAGSSCLAWEKTVSPGDTQRGLLETWVRETSPRLGGAKAKNSGRAELGGRPFLRSEFELIHRGLPNRLLLYVGPIKGGRVFYFMTHDSGLEEAKRFEEILASARWKTE